MSALILKPFLGWWAAALAAELKSRTAYSAKWRQENPDKVAANKVRWQQSNPEKHAAYQAKWRQENQEKHKEAVIKWRQANPEKQKENVRKWNLANPDKVAAKSVKWRQANREKVQERDNKYQKERRARDSGFKLLCALRRRLAKALRGVGVRSAHTLELLGCSVEQLRTHLESQFKPGMTWKNHGYRGWHVDHIRPCASFDLTQPGQQRQCFHFSNLQPLWAAENRLKSDKINP